MFVIKISLKEEERGIFMLQQLNGMSVICAKLIHSKDVATLLRFPWSMLQDATDLVK